MSTADQDNLRSDIIRAITAMGHEIDGSKVVLFRDKAADGNALSQLVDHVVNAMQSRQCLHQITEPTPQWQPIKTAPKDECVLVCMGAIEAVDVAFLRSDVNRWVSGGGTVWPQGVCTHWMPLPQPTSSKAVKDPQ